MMISPAVAAVQAAARGAAAVSVASEASGRGDDVGGARRRPRSRVGLLRVGIEARLVQQQLARGALEGRLIVTVAKKTDGMPGDPLRRSS